MMTDVLKIWGIKLVKAEQNRLVELHYPPHKFEIIVDIKHGYIRFKRRYNKELDKR